MKTVIRAAVGAASLFGLGVSNLVMAGEQLILATSDVEAPAYTAGVGLASLIKFELQPVHKIDVQAISSSGPVDNIRMMRDGIADFAILPSITGHAARSASGSFAGNKPELQLRAVTTLWHDALHLMVRDDDAPTGTIQDFLELKDGKVFLGNEGTGSIEANHLLLSGLGLDIDSTFDVLPVPDGNVIKAIKQGSLDALSIASRPPNLMFHDVGDMPSSGLTFLDITIDQMTKANGSHWLWIPYTIPATTYPGQDEDILTVAHANLLVVNAEVPEETVYLITKSIFENLSYLYRVDPLLTGLALDKALPGMSLPLHPGALRYFKEAGLIPDIVFPKAPHNSEQPSRHKKTSYPNSNVAEGWQRDSDDPALLATPFGTIPGKLKGSKPPSLTTDSSPKPKKPLHNSAVL